MSIRTILTGAAGTAALALGVTTAPALADDLPQAGDECTPRDSRETVELPDGSVQECQRPADGGRDWSWVIVIEPTEAPTDEPTQEPTEEPTETPSPEPTEAPTEEPTEEPTDEPGEPAPDEWTEFVDLLEPAPDSVHPGQFCKNDEALLIWGYGDNAIQCQYNEESDRYQWVEVKGFDELIIEDEDPTDPEDPGEGDGDDKPAPPTDKEDGEDPATGDASDRSLPVTGGALAGLVVAAMTATGAGATALWATRRRSGHDEDGETREDDAA